VIVRVDGERVTGVDDLIRLLNAGRIGRMVTFDVLRRGQLRSFDVRPTERLASATRKVDFETRRTCFRSRTGLGSIAGRSLAKRGSMWDLPSNEKPPLRESL